jgi:Helicase HerA, central domain
MTKLPIPPEALQQHVIVLGKTRSGKSSKVRVLVEWLLEHKKRVVILSPKDDWWGLKSAADGKSGGYPIVIFGGKHEDLPFNPRAGAQVAELIATGNRPCLITFARQKPADRTRFYNEFMEGLFKFHQGELYVVIDEVHNFAPKGKVFSPDAGMMIHWSNTLASEGQGQGLIMIAASQRPQKVHNDLLTSCETLIACRVIHKADRDANKDWIDGCADPEVGRQLLADLASMDRSDAWCWSPEIGFGPKRITWPMFDTFDSFKPSGAAAPAKLKGWADVDLDEVKVKLAKVVEEAQANDPVELKKRIVELERQVKAAPAPAAGASQDELIAAQNLGYQEGRSTGYKEGRVDIVEQLEVYYGSLESWRKGMPQPPVFKTAAAPPLRDIPPLRQLARGTTKVPHSQTPTFSLPPGEHATLTALIQFPEGLARNQLTVLTQYKRSSRDAYIQRLREKGLVETNGDTVKATEDGILAIPDAAPLPTGQDLQEHWLRQLPSGEAKVLQVLIEAYPNAVQREALSEATGFARSSRDAYLQRMKAKQLWTEPSRGEVRASEDLF